MAIKSAGRVSIRVVPDSVGFKRDLQKSLERIERQLKARIQAELYLDRASLAVLKRQIESLVVRIKPKIELNISPAEIAELRAKIERMRPHIRVDLDTALASRRIATLSRTRFVDIVARLRNSSILNNFSKKLQGLAGLNVVRDMFRTGINFFQNIDRNAVKLGAVFAKVGAIVALTGALGQNLVVMTAQLVSMIGITTLAPAFLIGMAISVGILAAALKDMDEVLADLGPGFAAFQDSISTDFWREAAQPIRDVVNALLPVLHTTEGRTNTARSLGQFVAEMANSLKDLLTAEKLTTMFDRMNDSIDILKGAVRPLTNAFVNLGLHGTRYFERFSNWVVKLSNQFDNFITRSAENGDLDRWTENAIQAFKDLGNATKGVVRFFGEINRAAKAAGAMDFGDLGDSLNRAADIMSSSRFQTVMTRIFQGMNIAVEGIVKGIAKLGPALEIASPTIFRVFSIIGDIAQRVGGMVAGVISNPDFLAGFEQFFTGINRALKNLEPSVEPFAKSLGGILGLMGQMISAVAEIVNAITVELGPELDLIGLEFAKLIDPLKDTVLNFVTEMKPTLEKFRTDVIAPLVALINEQLLPAVNKIVTFLGPSFRVVLGEVKEFIEDDLTPVLAGLNGTLDGLNGKGESFAAWLQSVMDLLPRLGTIEWLREVMPGFQGGWATEGGEERFRQDWDNFWRPILKFWNEEAWPAIERQLLHELQRFETWCKEEFAPAVLDALGSIWDSVWRRLTGQPQEGAKSPGDIISDWWNGLIEGIKEELRKKYEEFKVWVQDWIKTWNPFQPMIDFLKDPFGEIWDGTGSSGKFGPKPALSSNIFDDLKEQSSMQTMIDGLVTKAKSLGPAVAAAIGTSKIYIDEAWITLWGGLVAKTTEAMNNVRSNITIQMATLGATMINGLTVVSSMWSVGWLIIQALTAQAWQNIRITTEVGIASLGATMINSLLVAGKMWDVGWTIIKAITTQAWQNIITTTESQIASLAATMITSLLVAGKMWDVGWTIIKTITNVAWVSIIETSRNQIAALAASMINGLIVASRMWDVGWSIVRGITQGAWNTLLAVTRQGVAAVVAEVASIAWRAAQSVGDMSGTLYWSGASLVAGFAAGIRSQKGAAAAAAAEVAQAVADQMPHSPAKEGPLSGRGYTTYSGQALVRDFASGMMDNMNLVRDSTAAVAAAARIGANMDLTTDLDKDGVVIDRREVNLSIYHPVAEPTSRTIEQAAQTLRMAKAL